MYHTCALAPQPTRLLGCDDLHAIRCCKSSQEHTNVDMYVGDDFPFREDALLSVGPVTVISHAPITVLNTNAAKEIDA